MLNILERSTSRAWAPIREALHLMIEAKKLAFEVVPVHRGSQNSPRSPSRN